MPNNEITRAFSINVGDQAVVARAGRNAAEEGESSAPVRVAPAALAVISIRHSFKL